MQKFSRGNSNSARQLLDAKSHTARLRHVTCLLSNPILSSFLSEVPTLLEELEKHAPDIHSQLKTLVGCVQNSKGKLSHLEINEKGCKIFSSLPSLSIDYAVMEKSSKVVLVPANIGWSDVGAWNALDDV